MKALTKTTIIIMLASSVPAAVFAQAPSTPAASVSVQHGELAAAEQPVAPIPPIQENRSVGVSVWPSERSSGGTVLVIPSTEMKPEDISAVMEDMSIMSRILDKNLGQERLTTTSTGVFLSRNTDPWSDVFVGRGRATQAIYLEGFGSLFLISIDFPLSAPPKVQEEKPEEGVDTVWRETQREIYSPGDRGRRVKVQPQKEYDAEKVQELQKTIIKTLKHAANIRGLKTDEWVTILVKSSAPPVIVTSTIVTRSTGETLPAETNVRTSSASAALPAETVPGQVTFLTIRAKKSDIDSFAKNQLDYDKFSQRVSVLTY
jgi:hypothetical protein